MADDAPPKPKVGSLRDRIAAFERPAQAATSGPPPPRPKPAALGTWKPKPLEPAAVPHEPETDGESKGRAGMSADDAKESITRGAGGLKERMAALQGRGGFGAQPANMGPPLPSSDKPRVWRKPIEVPTAAADDEGATPAIAPAAATYEPESKEHPVEGGSEGPTESKNDEEEEERERRARIAARMAKLGGTRVGMAPVFGKPAVPIPKPKVDTEGAENVARIPLPGSSSSLLSPVSGDEEITRSVSPGPKSPESMPAPAIPRRAGPPRRKSAKNLKAAAAAAAEAEAEPLPVPTQGDHAEAGGDQATKSPVVEQVEEAPKPYAEPVETPESAPGTPPPPSPSPSPSVASHVELLTEDEHEEESGKTPSNLYIPSSNVHATDSGQDSPTRPKHEDYEASLLTPRPSEYNEGTRDFGLDAEPNIKAEPDSPPVPPRLIIKQEQLSPTIPPSEAEEEEQAYEESEDDEAARKKRIAEKLSKMGGVNYFSPTQGSGGLGGTLASPLSPKEDEEEGVSKAAVSPNDDKDDEDTTKSSEVQVKKDSHSPTDVNSEKKSEFQDHVDVLSVPRKQSSSSSTQDDNDSDVEYPIFSPQATEAPQWPGSSIAVPGSFGSTKHEVSALATQEASGPDSTRKDGFGHKNLPPIPLESPVSYQTSHIPDTQRVTGSADDNMAIGRLPPPIQLSQRRGSQGSVKSFDNKGQKNDSTPVSRSSSPAPVQPPSRSSSLRQSIQAPPRQPTYPSADVEEKGGSAVAEEPQPIAPRPVRRAIPALPKPALGQSASDADEDSPVSEDSHEQEADVVAPKPIPARRAIPPVPKSFSSMSVDESERTNEQPKPNPIPQRSIPVVPKPIGAQVTITESNPISPPNRATSPPPRRATSPPPPQTALNRPAVPIPAFFNRATSPPPIAAGLVKGKKPKEGTAEGEEEQIGSPLDDGVIVRAPAKPSLPPPKWDDFSPASFGLPDPAPSSGPAPPADKAPEPASDEKPEVAAGEDNDPEATRRRTIADRMAKLGGVRFGAPPPVRPIARKVSVPEEEAPAAEKPETEVDPNMSPEEAARSRRAAIAARMAAMGGRGLGMYGAPPPAASQPAPTPVLAPAFTPTPAPPRAPPKHRTSSLGKPPSVPLAKPTPVPALPPKNVQGSAIDTESEPEMLNGSETEPDDGEIVEKNDQEEDEPEFVEHPPAPPPRTGRPPIPRGAPPKAPVPIRAIPRQLQDEEIERPRSASPTARARTPPTLPGGRRGSGRNVPIQTASNTNEYVMVPGGQVTPQQTMMMGARSRSPEMDASAEWEHTPVSSSWKGADSLSELRGEDLSWSHVGESAQATPPPRPVPRTPPRRGSGPFMGISPEPVPSSDLASLAQTLGPQILESATQVHERSKKAPIGDGSSASFIYETVSVVPGASTATFGHLVYSQTGGNVRKRLGDIMAGDIIALYDARFKGHKGLGGLGAYTLACGTENDPLLGIVSEFEAKRSKIRAYSVNQHPNAYPTIDSPSYKLEDLKSGTVKIFRVARA